MRRAHPDATFLLSLSEYRDWWTAKEYSSRHHILLSAT
jgi:hypothetical protein